MYPYLFRIFSRDIPSYGVCMLLAFFLVFALSVRRAKQKSIVMEDVIIVGVTAVANAIFLAKLLYILVTYTWADITAMLASGDFSFLTGDGLVFYGGLIGGILGAFLGARIAGLPLASLESSIVPFLPLGHAIGRIGCALAGCCYGIEYDGPGAIYYPDTVFPFPADVGYFPVQFVEAFFDICIMLCLLFWSKKELKSWTLLFRYLFLYSILRFCTECLRGDAVRGQFFALTTSKWISIFLFCLSLAFFVMQKIRYKSSEKL